MRHERKARNKQILYQTISYVCVMQDCRCLVFVFDISAISWRYNGTCVYSVTCVHIETIIFFLRETYLSTSTANSTIYKGKIWLDKLHSTNNSHSSDISRRYKNANIAPCTMISKFKATAMCNHKGSWVMTDELIRHISKH